MKWIKIKTLLNYLKPTLKFINNIMIPTLATVVLWSYLDRIVSILAALVLSTLWLRYMGFNVNVATRMRKTRPWKFISFMLRSTSPIAKMNEEYFTETGKFLADQTILVAKQVKKIEEEIKMNKIKKWRKEFLLFVTHNKKMLTLYIVVMLFFLDMYFGWTKLYNLPPDAIYYVAVLIIAFILWAAGGEGWTFNSVNKFRQEVFQVKKLAKKERKKWQTKLDDLITEIDDILDSQIDGKVPPHLQTRYNELIKSKELFTNKVNQLSEKINEEELK